MVLSRSDVLNGSSLGGSASGDGCCSIAVSVSGDMVRHAEGSLSSSIKPIADTGYMEAGLSSPISSTLEYRERHDGKIWKGMRGRHQHRRKRAMR